ncbi:MAG: DUF2431 domain-containing protein [Proteobacteria bacterium]|nr:DUF2431 domain-containing protein [Pseudomonadota bacterium]
MSNKAIEECMTIIRMANYNAALLHRCLLTESCSRDKIETLRKIDLALFKLFQGATSQAVFKEFLVVGDTLLLGEGNLSFALSLLKIRAIKASNMTATTFESISDLSLAAKLNAKVLYSYGAQVLYDIDATKLRQQFGTKLFNNIIFQFPHVGSREAVCGYNPNYILVKDFMRSARNQLRYDGVVIISAVDNQYYNSIFQFEKIAEITGFKPPEGYPFEPRAFPGYEHTMAHREGDALENHEKLTTWVFRSS